MPLKEFSAAFHFFLQQIFDDQQHDHSGGAEETCYQSVDPVQIQSDPDDASYDIDQKKDHKPGHGIQKQLQDPFEVMVNRTKESICIKICYYVKNTSLILHVTGL